MTTYRVIVDGDDGHHEHAFDGEPQINLTFEMDHKPYRVVTRAHDEHVNEGDTPTLHAVSI